MGPRAFTRGDKHCRGQLGISQRASMGPRAFTRGDESKLARRPKDGWASMGPRAFTRGDTGSGSGGARSLSGFNGATRIHAWRPHYHPRPGHARPRFNGATRIHAWRPNPAAKLKSLRLALQWGHAHSRVETKWTRFPRTPSASASMGPRAFTRGDSISPSALTRSFRASMGPRAFTRGDVLAVELAPPIVLASMGPRAFTRGDGRGAVAPPQTPPASMGPRAFTRGDLRIDLNRVLWRAASMGPRAFTRGDVFQPQLRSVTLRLQWGHAHSRVETPVSGSISDKK